MSPRKTPDYFNDREDLRLVWADGARRWEVGYLCSHDVCWHWSPLKAKKAGDELKQEAFRAAAQLMRASALRWNYKMAQARGRWRAVQDEADEFERKGSNT